MASIAELILAQGRQQAEARRRRGDISAQMWNNLGTIAAQTAAGLAKEKAEAPIRAQDAELRGLQLARGRQELTAGQRTLDEDAALRDVFTQTPTPTVDQLSAVVGPERGVAIAKGLAALRPNPQQQYADTQKVLQDVVVGMNALPEGLRGEYYPHVRADLIQRGVITPNDAPESYDPAWWTATLHHGQEPPKPNLQSVDPTKPIVDMNTGQTVTPPTQTAPEQTYEIVVKGPNGRPVKKLVTAAELRQGVETYQEPKEAPRGSFEQQIADALARGDQETVGRLTQAAELAAGARSRTQGRPVTSGDAGRLAEFDTSLDDLAVLTKTVSGNGATGIAAQAGAKLPNWATNLTGWGTDAKQKQATIDRVKQVIGKALEGGVLRKEDEYKYEKILPTIGDPPAVVATKLAGLASAITKRRQTQIEALEDAGYDVTKFTQRAPHGQSGTIRARDPQGVLHEAPAGTPLPGGWTVER